MPRREIDLRERAVLVKESVAVAGRVSKAAHNKPQNIYAKGHGVCRARRIDLRKDAALARECLRHPGSVGKHADDVSQRIEDATRAGFCFLPCFRFLFAELLMCSIKQSLPGNRIVKRFHSHDAKQCLLHLSTIDPRLT